MLSHLQAAHSCALKKKGEEKGWIRQAFSTNFTRYMMSVMTGLILAVLPMKRNAMATTSLTMYGHFERRSSIALYVGSLIYGLMKKSVESPV